MTISYRAFWGMVAVTAVLPSSGFAQAYQTCFSSNLYEDNISHVTEGFAPNAAMDALMRCIRDSAEQGVDGCQCSVECSPTGGFAATRLPALINQIILDNAISMKRCSE